MSGRLRARYLARRLRHRLAEGVVLVDQVHVLDLLAVLGHVGGQRLHLHVAVGVEAEMPEAALRVGEVRVHRGVVQVQDLLAGVALVVLVHRVDQRAGDRGAVALRDEADALVDHLLQHVQGFLRADLVVEGDDLELRPAGLPLLLMSSMTNWNCFSPLLADVGERPGKRVDVGDLDGLRMRGERNECGGSGERGRADHALDHGCLLLERQKWYRWHPSGQGRR